MVAKKPRVVVIGAGMAGLSAASQLHQAEGGASTFSVVVLEASLRMGGRILTSQIGGDRVEVGATWIHGVHGSPLHKIAQRIGAVHASDMPWERQDGFPRQPITRAEGGVGVDASITNPVADLYKKMLVEIRSRDGAHSHQGASGSIGSFVRQGFREYLSQQHQQEPHEMDSRCEWTLRELQESVFATHEYMERVATSANSVYDLDCGAEHEYKEYSGEHITIGMGYMSIIDELAKSLPDGAIKFGKRVAKISWNHHSPSSQSPVVIYCEDGSFFEADHVIITVSLGVLKAGCSSPANSSSWACPEGRPVRRSLDDLAAPHFSTVKQALFDPPLPPSKLEAISRLGYGVVNKLFLLLDPTAASSSAMVELQQHVQLLYRNEGRRNEALGPWWMRKTFSVAPIYEGSKVLLLWFAGQEALELEGLSDEEVIHGVATTLASFGLAQGQEGGGGARREASSSSSDSEESSDDGAFCERVCRMFSGVLRSRWASDPLFNGSYSFVATGASGKDIDELAQPLPPQLQAQACLTPHPREEPLQLLFAGEATHRYRYSTTHGAHLSGLREANRLLHHYGLSHVNLD